MTPDHLDPRDLGSNDDVPFVPRHRDAGSREQRESADRPLTDREVPLDPLRIHPMIHDWLDGEVAEEQARTAVGERKVEMWSHINAQAELLRRRTTPVYMTQRILDALPHDSAVATIGGARRVGAGLGTQPWYRRSVAVSPILLIGGSIGILLLGATLAQLLRNQ